MILRLIVWRDSELLPTRDLGDQWTPALIASLRSRVVFQAFGAVHLEVTIRRLLRPADGFRSREPHRRVRVASVPLTPSKKYPALR